MTAGRFRGQAPSGGRALSHLIRQAPARLPGGALSHRRTPASRRIPRKEPRHAHRPPRPEIRGPRRLRRPRRRPARRRLLQRRPGRRGRRRRQDHADREPVLRVRLRGPLQAVRAAAPQHHHQGEPRRPRRPPPEPARPPAGCSGTADIEAIEIGQVAGFQPQASKFVDFLQYGVSKDQWVPSKTAPASSADGKALFGLGTDMGGLALCYRSDLFKAAGLPTDRDQVSALLADWPAYTAAGKQFLAKSPTKGAKWFDSAGNLFSAIVAQSPTGFYDASGKPVVQENPAVKQAFDLVAGAVKDGQSAGIQAFTPAWDTGFQKSQFATVACPAWMSYEFKGNPPTDGGTWDIARIPGGGGNWGGSYLTVPKSGKHTKAAVELAKWLTAPEQESWLFKNKGYFPSDQALWSQPDIAGFTDPLFNGAPTGKIFSQSAKDLQPQPLGAHGAEIGTAVGNALTSIEQGKADPATAWQKALADVANITG
ncbi:extracellular solute-binding protein [Kitasatospora arboriphila]